MWPGQNRLAYAVREQQHRGLWFSRPTWPVRKTNLRYELLCVSGQNRLALAVFEQQHSTVCAENSHTEHTERLNIVKVRTQQTNKTYSGPRGGVAA